MKKPSNTPSTILSKIAQKKFKSKLTYRYLVEELGDHAFGLAILFFALPNILPLSSIPGFSFIFSIPIAIFSFQMIFHYNQLWLPKKIADHVISHEKISKIIRVALPVLIRLERLTKPRLLFMTSQWMKSINGIVIFCLAFLLILPIPLSNGIISILIIILSIGLIRRDGLFILLGYIASVIYISLIYFTIFLAIQTLLEKILSLTK